MPEPQPEISIIVRARNDEVLIARTLSALTTQTINPVEILCFDNASTDRTAETARSYPRVKVFDAPAPYNPARVLNYAVSRARAPIVVFNNSDAVPLSPDYLEKLLAPLSDPGVTAVFGNQVCRADAAPLVRKDYERAFGDGRISASWRNFFSLASSAIRRKTLLEHPFDEKFQYSEDTAWAWQCKQRGGRIVYVPDAQVEHSHNYPPRTMWKRFFNEGYYDVLIYGDAMPFFTACRQFVMESLRDVLWLMRRRNFAALCKIPVYRFIQKFAAWSGGRTARRKEKII